MAIRAVAFDLDYTLAVPDRERETILTEAVEATGAPSISRQAYLDAHHEHLTDETREPIFAALLDARGSDIDPADLTSEYRERITEALRPVPGVEAMLADLRRSYRTGLLTNGPRVAQRAKLEALGWTDAFDATLVTGELPAGKPHPVAFTALVEALGTEPGETVFVGDRPDDDIAGASEAGLVPVQVTFDGGPDPDSRAAAHVPRDTLAERLPDLLNDL